MAEDLVRGASALPRRLGRSTLAVLAGFVATAVVSVGTDQVLHMLRVYPPWGQPMEEPGLNLLALSYRIVYTIGGGYIAARLAPRNPMRHALALGVVGLVPSIAGVIVAITAVHLGPIWYPIAIVLTAMPCVWLGGIIHGKFTSRK